MASSPPWPSLRIRVSTFPRIATISKSGRKFLSWARRRSEPVPTFAFLGRWRRESYFLETKTSRASSRFRMALIMSPWGKTAGISFILWTPAWIFLSRICSSISFKNSPLPPISVRGVLMTLSPVVLITLIVTERSWDSSSSCFLTKFSCHRASGLPRLPKTRRLLDGTINSLS